VLPKNPSLICHAPVASHCPVVGSALNWQGQPQLQLQLTTSSPAIRHLVFVGSLIFLFLYHAELISDWFFPVNGKLVPRTSLSLREHARVDIRCYLRSSDPWTELRRRITAPGGGGNRTNKVRTNIWNSIAQRHIQDKPEFGCFSPGRDSSLQSPIMEGDNPKDIERHEGDLDKLAQRITALEHDLELILSFPGGAKQSNHRHRQSGRQFRVGPNPSQEMCRAG
jgi:hypothetical protein